MKRRFSSIFATLVLMSAAASVSKPAHAQVTIPNLSAFGNTILGGLLNVNLGILQGAVVVVDVHDVDILNGSLNNNDVAILQNFLNDVTVTVDDTLNNLLRDADIIKNNQVVVGILSGPIPVIFTANK